MKKTIFALLIILSGLFLAGCGNGISGYEELFTCNSSNMIGLKGVYYKDNIILLAVETDDDLSEETSNSKFDYDSSASKSQSYFTVHTTTDELVKVDDESEVYELDKGWISFSVGDCRAEDIKDVCYRYGSSYYTIDIADGTIRKEIMGGEVSNIFTQSYDAKSDTWGEILTENVYYPLTSGN